jgi:acyl dehydratase
MPFADKVGLSLPAFDVDVERFQLRLFAIAIGEQRPEYVDVEAARLAGYKDLPAPPTFAFSIAMRPEDPFDLLRLLEVDLGRVLHGEQSFEYIGPICAGDRVRVDRKVVAAYEKKSGSLQFFIVEVTCSDVRDGRPLIRARQTIIHRLEAAQ